MGKPKIKTLKRKLDAMFSEFVRRDTADRRGLCTCVSCGTKKHWKEMDCGHFISRNHNAGRYDIFNCGPQCKKCNRFREGNKAGFAIYIIENYGVPMLYTLRDKQYEEKQWTERELADLLRRYETMVKAL